MSVVGNDVQHAQSIPSANPRAPIPIPAAAVIAGAAFCVTCEGVAVGVAMLVPGVRVTTALLPVVAAEATDEATELALAVLKELWTVKLQRVRTSRTSLSFTPSSSSVSTSYCATHASQLGIRVLALAAVQMQLSSAASLSNHCVSDGLTREEKVLNTPNRLSQSRARLTTAAHTWMHC